jgi:N-acetylmuramic acid 6-phosphate etherase
MKSTDHSLPLALDLGGTWVKGAVCPGAGLPSDPEDLQICKWLNPLAERPSAEAYAGFLAECCQELAGRRTISSVVISTAGEVGPSGRDYRISAPHLGAMSRERWIEKLEAKIGCSVSLINDADAFLLGLATAGILPRLGNIGILPVGTGIGFSVVRDGRRWMPGRRLNFLGSILTPEGDYDAWGSAVRVAERAGGDLRSLFADEASLQPYLCALGRIISTAANLYFLDRVFIGGGLAGAACEARFPLASAIHPHVLTGLLPGLACPEIQVVEEANRRTLQGALALAAGTSIANAAAFDGLFHLLRTEQPGDARDIEKKSPAQIAAALAISEKNAAERFMDSCDVLGSEAAIMADKLKGGGRVIYVGAGTSGRIAALDAVEIPCTYGMARDCFVSLIAGGSADATLTIESDSEEDFSAVPDMILLNPGPLDTLVGISASGTAFFVRSALAYAKAKGARTILIHEAAVEKETFFDASIPLYSGPEIVCGSTRMKAGTATKKALNILSTTAMILLGKVRSGHMIDLDSSNRKLRLRAVRILADLKNLSREDAESQLRANSWDLPRTLDHV